MSIKGPRYRGIHLPTLQQTSTASWALYNEWVEEYKGLGSEWGHLTVSSVSSVSLHKPLRRAVMRTEGADMKVGNKEYDSKQGNRCIQVMWPNTLLNFMKKKDEGWFLNKAVTSFPTYFMQKCIEYYIYFLYSYSCWSPWQNTLAVAKILRPGGSRPTLNHANHTRTRKLQTSYQNYQTILHIWKPLE